MGLTLTGALPGAVLANPQGATVAAGSVTIKRTATRVDVHQASERTIIDWRSFSIAPGEVTQFHQPSAASMALNRVTGADPSHIFGSLIANGRVILINPNGILFGAGSRIDVSGLVATTTDVHNHDFMAGRMAFSMPSANPRASVVNEGQITIADAGHAALVAPHVRNSGTIDARLGRVTLGAAETFAVDLYGDDLVTFRVGVRQTPVDAEGNPVKALVANDGRILAGGGIVRLAANNVEAVVRNVINTDGVIYANAIERRGGKIIIKAAGAGNVAAGGVLSAVAGTVDISGDEDVAVTDATVAAAELSFSGDTDRSGAGDLNAGPTGGDVLVTDTVLTAGGADGNGGKVTITADRVALLGTTRIDADGATGGGDVQIGGDFQGKGETRNADATIVGAKTQISADAGEAGDGGRVILWADGYTRFHGDITATGGATSGDGGFVEVSGKRNLGFVGSVNVAAPAGAAGTLLLDPNDIIVATGGLAAATDVDAFADPGLIVLIDPATLDGVGGNVILQATSDITITNAVNLTTAGATFTAVANDSINVNDHITTNNAAITLTADFVGNGIGDVDVAVGKAVTTNGSSLSITANDLTLSGTLNSGAGGTTIQVSDAGTIGLGATAGGMTVSGAELQQITATGLTIGNATNGDITVDGITAANSNNIAGTVSLTATNAAAGGASVTFATGASTFNALTVTADKSVSANVALTTDTGAINFAAGDAVSLNADVTSAGAVTINADNGAAGTGTFSIAATKALVTTNNNLVITTKDIDLVGTIDTGTGSATILESQAGKSIGIGAAIGTGISLSGAELQNITATGLTIGDTTNGSITVDGISAANSNNITGTTTLNATAAGAGIAFSTTASTFNALTASADDQIAVNVDVTTDVGNLALDGDADNAADTNDNITFAVGRTLTSAGSLSLDGTTGGMTGAGALTLNSASGFTLNDNLTTAGTTVIDADTDKNGIGDFTIAAAKALNTTTNTLSITANDMVLTGTLNSGAAATTLLVSDGGTIGLGATAGNMTISGAELQNITATGLTLGDTTNGSITVDGISAANSNNITGTTTLNATAAGAGIAFSTTASTFNALTANADDQIAVNVDVTTDIGNLALDGDADNAADTNDNITFAVGRTLTSAGALSLDGTTGGMTGTGGLTLNANNGVTLSVAFTGAGTTAINADVDGNSSGNVTATTLNLGANGLTATGVNVNTGTSLTAGAVTLNGAVTGSGLTVASLTLTGASAALTSTTVGGQTGSNAAIATTMPDAATHLVNNCQKSGCAASPAANPPPAVINPILASPGTASAVPPANPGSNSPPAGSPDSASVAPTESPSTSPSTSPAPAGGWAEATFNAAAGDTLLTESAATFRVFFEMLKDEGADNLDLLEASDNLGNPEIASLVAALGEILGEYAFVTASIPTNAFKDKAQTILPGLLNFEPVAGDAIANPSGRRDYQPPSLGQFQF